MSTLMGRSKEDRQRPTDRPMAASQQHDPEQQQAVERRSTDPNPPLVRRCNCDGARWVWVMDGVEEKLSACSSDASSTPATQKSSMSLCVKRVNIWRDNASKCSNAGRVGAHECLPQSKKRPKSLPAASRFRELSRCRGQIESANLSIAPERSAPVHKTVGEMRDNGSA